MSQKNDRHGAATCSWCDTGAVYVLGCLDADESRAFEEHLLEGCSVCGGEVRAAREQAAVVDREVAQSDLARSSTYIPSERMRRRLFEKLDAVPESGSGEPDAETLDRFEPSSRPGIAQVRGGDEGWEPMDVDGISKKVLAIDHERRLRTMVVRMEPGTSYPSHRHAAREECFVIDGDIEFEGTQLRAGDYQVAKAGSVHPVQSTQGGCTLLIVDSLDDVRIATA